MEPVDSRTNWNMSQERAFTENLLCQRFNYFIVFYSIIVAGFINTPNKIYAQLILTLGTVITVLFASVLNRTQKKLDALLEEIFKDDSHPATIADKKVGGSSGSRRRIIGFWIPTI